MVDYAGSLALLGRPNVGKSTLFNRLLGRRVAAVTRKPHTTRCNIRGVLEVESKRYVLVDTPGLHRDKQHQLNRALNQNVARALERVQACLLISECDAWRRDDGAILKLIQDVGKPCVLILNKVDRLRDKTELLDVLRRRDELHDFHALIPLSARFDSSHDELNREIAKLPMAQAVDGAVDANADATAGGEGGDDAITSERSLIEEIVREQLLLNMRDEVPYAAHVRVALVEKRGRALFCAARIIVERESQRAIVVGRGGRSIKQLGIRARRVLQTVLKKPIYLELRVQVVGAWRNDPNIVRSYMSDRLA